MTKETLQTYVVINPDTTLLFLKNGFSDTRTVMNTKQPINNIKIIKDNRINILNSDIKFKFEFIRSKLTF